LNRRRRCHLANALKHTVNKGTAKYSTSGISIVSLLHAYSRQRRTIGSFSATAGLYLYLFRWMRTGLICGQNLSHKVHSTILPSFYFGKNNRSFQLPIRLLH